MIYLKAYGKDTLSKTSTIRINTNDIHQANAAYVEFIDARAAGYYKKLLLSWWLGEGKKSEDILRALTRPLFSEGRENKT